jgi:hypothetical protein
MFETCSEAGSNSVYSAGGDTPILPNYIIVWYSGVMLPFAFTADFLDFLLGLPCCLDAPAE